MKLRVFKHLVGLTLLSLFLFSISTAARAADTGLFVWIHNYTSEDYSLAFELNSGFMAYTPDSSGYTVPHNTTVRESLYVHSDQSGEGTLKHTSKQNSANYCNVTLTYDSATKKTTCKIASSISCTCTPQAYSPGYFDVYIGKL